MISLIRTLLGNDQRNPETAETGEEKRRLAACVLLLEAGYADDECTAEEMDLIEETVRRRFALAPDIAADLLALADRKRRSSVDLWSFTNDLNQQLGREEKIGVLKDVWRIILADGRLDSHEDHLAHKLATLLRLTHKDLIDAKLAAKEDGAGGRIEP